MAQGSIEEAALERARQELKRYLRDNPRPDDGFHSRQMEHAEEVMWRTKAIAALESKVSQQKKFYEFISSPLAGAVWEGWVSQDPSLVEADAEENSPLPLEVILWLDPSSGPVVSLPLDCSPGSL